MTMRMRLKRDLEPKKTPLGLTCKLRTSEPVPVNTMNEIEELRDLLTDGVMILDGIKEAPEPNPQSEDSEA